MIEYMRQNTETAKLIYDILKEKSGVKERVNYVLRTTNCITSLGFNFVKNFGIIS